MFARGNINTAAVLSQKHTTPDTGSIHRYLARQGIEKRSQNEKMIPLNNYTTKYGRRVSTEKGAATFDRRRTIPRLNSAPELYIKPELPPILGHGKVGNVCAERRNRPLTPLVVNSSRSQTTKSLPKNYRINLDLVPLVEVGSCLGNLSISRRRQASLSSSDSCFSSSTPSPRLQSRSGSPRGHSEAKDDLLGRSLGLQKRTNSAESLEEVDSDSEDVHDGKDSMILRWLQTVEKTHENAGSTGELLPCIKEGKLA